MQNKGSILRAALAAVGILVCASSASAQMPMPTNETPTVNGAQPVTGIVGTAEVGYPALRMGVLFGEGGSFDWGIKLAAPTFGGRALGGYFQGLGLDLRAPLRFKLLDSEKLVGSLRVSPLFHVGRAGGRCARVNVPGFGRIGGCNNFTALGLGVAVAFLMDIPLPKIFKLIIGPEFRAGLYHNEAPVNAFAGEFVVDAGIEAFWKEKFFFTFIMSVGANFRTNAGGGGTNATFREMMGFGYKFR